MAHDGLPSPPDGTAPAAGASIADSGWQPPDWRGNLQLALATIWLLDGVLQLQPSMFRGGSNGLSGMLAGTAPGNPGWVARTITWNASIVGHHAMASNAVFALVQIAIGLGIAWRPSRRLALGASIVWSAGVWWFGEGLGGILHGAGTPIAGGPGAVLFYALLAVVLWPPGRLGNGVDIDAADGVGFAAAEGVGIRRAKIIWGVLWIGLAFLAVIGSGRSPSGVHDIVSTYSGQPGWLSTINRYVASAVSGRGLLVAMTFAFICLLMAASVFLPANLTRVSLSLGMATALVVWVAGQNFGGILAGGATDPNSAPLLVLLALAYWPVPVLAPAIAAADHLRPVVIGVA